MQVLELDQASCPEAGGLARDACRAECALSATPTPRIEMTVQKKTTTSRVGWVGGSLFFSLHLTPCSRC